MALPTAATYGYGYFYTIGDKSPDVACNCLREWIPTLQRMLRHKGILGPTERLAVWQCTGGNPLSGGTHTKGGATDIKLLDASRWDSTRRYKLIGPRSAAALRVIREMCGGAAWPRYDVDGRPDGDPWENNEHFHIVLRGCVHNSPCRYQIDEYDDGYDGMVGSGRDTFWRPATKRTWTQGIAWAKAQMGDTAPTTTTTTPTAPTPEEDDVLSKEAQDWIEARMDAHDAYIIDSLRDSKTANALFAGHPILKDYRAADPDTAPRITPSNALERSTWGQRVKRTEGDTTALDELAATRTQVAAIAAAVEALAARLEELHPKA